VIRVELSVDSECNPGMDFTFLKDLHKIIQEELDPNIDHNWVAALKFVTSEEIQSLNKVYRNIDKPTNVLSFGDDLSKSTKDSFLGDLAICLDVVRREALEQKKQINDHLSHLYIHGVLHLLGYDHANENSALVMEALEKKILSKIEVADPY